MTTNSLRSLQIEELRRAKELLWQKYPLLWVKERLGEEPVSFKWSLRDIYKNHQWDGDVDPLSSAWRSLANQRWVAIKAATGTGKTHWLARAMLWFLDVYPDSLVISTAPKESQLKQNLWGEVSVILNTYKKSRPFLRDKMLSIKPEGDNPACPYAERWEAIGFVSGVGADEQSATKYQGYHRKNMLIVCEEAAALHPAVINAIKNTSTDVNNLILMVGNPDSELDQLHLFSELSVKVDSYRISAYDHPNVVGQKTIIGGAVTQSSIDIRIQDFGIESPLFVSRVRGLVPTDQEHSLIKGSWVNECIDLNDEFGHRVVENGYNAVGVDVANSEKGDKAALVWGKSNVLHLIQEFQCPNASHLADNLVMSDEELIQEGRTVYGTPKLRDYDILPALIGIDTVGVGVSTLNQFLNHGITPTSLQGGAWREVIPIDPEMVSKEFPKGKPLYEFGSLRAQMYWELREDIRNKLIVIRIKDKAMRDQLKKELTVVRFKLTGGKVDIESKEQIKKRLGGKSPNVADAIVYWNWTRKAYRLAGISVGFIGGD